MEITKIDLACGKNKAEGFYGVDISDKVNADLVLDILKFPWPWEDNSIEEINCSHFIEHIAATELNGKDLLCVFMDECHRILKQGGKLVIHVPCARSNRAFQDPTHRRFIVAETFCYFNKAWRETQSLEHYNIDSDFDFTVDPIVPIAMTVLHPEAQARRFNESWNTVLDWRATLIKR